MTSLCRMCAYEQADCKGNKDLEKIKCEFFKKPQVFNAKEAAERIAELERELNKIVRCKDCRWYKQKQKNLPYNQSKSYCNRSCVVATKENDFCSYGERREE